MMADQSLPHRRQFLEDFVVEIGKADLAARAEDAVFVNEPFEVALSRLGQRVPRRPQIAEFGLAAPPWNLAGRQQRAFRRDMLERAVGVPELVADVEQVAAVVARENPSFRVE